MKKKRQYGSELIFLLVSMAMVLWIPEGRGGSVYPFPSGRSASEFPFDIPVPPSDTYVVNDTGSPTLDKYLLDSRFFLKYLPKEPLQIQIGEMGGQPVLTDLTVSSFVTHGSPHTGTVVADYIVAVVPFAKYVVSDLCDLTTWVMREVNADLEYSEVLTI